jgi:crossover junction endodeoxyribonuclease RuvC
VIILGLDVSSKKTGWAILKNGRFYKRENIDFGTIETPSSQPISKRLVIFRDALESILVRSKPDTIVIEDTFFSKNIATLKVLVRFSAVAQELSNRLLSIDPILISARQARTIMGSQDKEEVFKIIVNKYKLNTFKFSTHNDIADAIVLTLHVNSLKNEE